MACAQCLSRLKYDPTGRNSDYVWSLTCELYRAKYQIGGPFGLHDSDCIFVDDFGVQELVAVQWALTHWNQRNDVDEAKLGERISRA